jgi:hypothetical protein
MSKAMEEKRERARRNGTTKPVFETEYAGITATKAKRDLTRHPNGWVPCGYPGPWNPVTGEVGYCFLNENHAGYHMSRGLGRAPVDEYGNYDPTKGDG